MDIYDLEIRKLSYGDLVQLTPTFGSEFNRTHRDDLIDQDLQRISFHNPSQTSLHAELRKLPRRSLPLDL
jgi:hypothetical protein